MTFTLVAPIPLTETTTVLPNPNFGDQEGATGELNILRTVNGRRRTYVISKERRKLRWDFSLSRNKAVELFEFYSSYNAERISIEDHNERRWVGVITNNPFEIQMDRRGLPTRQNWPVGELCAVTIEFEGTLVSPDSSGAIIFAPNASSPIDLNQDVGIEVDLPAFQSLLHNWDAFQIIGSDNTIINTWPDLGSANNALIGTIGATFDPTIDRSPTYRKNSAIFNSRPTVAFEAVQGQLITSVAAMRTTSQTTVFPGRRGTIFWVFAHTVNPNWTAYLESLDPVFSDESRQSRLNTALADKSFVTETEFGVWSQQQGTVLGSSTVEQVHMAGASSTLFPINVRFNPTANELRLAILDIQPVPSLTPIIYTLSRDTDTNLRFRTNGVEREGATILNNAPYTGTFRVNDQSFIPQFDATIRGEWGQILIYNRRLVTSEMEDVERYLSLRWGIPLGSAPF